MNQVAKFLPRLVRDGLASVPPGNGSGAPKVRAMQAGVVFVDVSGYTLLTQRAVSAGSEKVERFNTRLNHFFQRIIQRVHAEGGDVVGFAGDAVLAVFPAVGGNLAGAALRAAWCALGCQRERLELSGTGLDTPQPTLPTRITVGCGPVSLVAFGRDGRRQHVLATGAAIRSVAMAQAAAVPGAVLLTAEARKALAGSARVTATAADRAFLASVEHPDAPGPTALVQAAPDAPPEALLPFLPRALTAHLDTSDLAWVAEMRFVCPVFLAIGGPEAGQEPALADVTAAVLTFEDELLALGGEVLHIRADEHGAVALGIFGTPGCTHEDDASRAVRAAQLASERLHAAGLQVDIGLCSGPALCAVYGTSDRCDYDVLGNVMNLAARLMQQHAGLLCDGDTARRAGVTFDAAHARTLTLKGVPGPVLALSPRGPVGAHGPRALGAEPLGRQREHEMVRTWLATDPPQARRLVIAGEAGIGKSTLTAFLLREATDRGTPCVLVHGSSTEHLTPYFVWRAVLRQLFGGADAPEALSAAVLARLGSDARLTHFAPLLNEILPLGIPPNATTLQMEPSARASTTAELLVHLLREGAPGGVLVFDDAHWIDSASWPVMAQAARNVADLKVVVTLRPDAPLPPEGREFLAEAGPDSIVLHGLSAAETADLIARCAGCEAAAPDVARFVQEHAAGNPLFIEELALVLLQRGRLRVEAGTCIAREGIDRFARHELPITMRAAILERIDGLSAAQLMLAKMASVVGAEADVGMLAQLVPAGAQPATVDTDLLQFQQRSLGMVRTAAAGRAVFSFRHAVIRETVYGMLTPSQRRALHLRVGEWLEASAGGRTDVLAPLLAHHFGCAADAPRARRYLAQAGEQALRAHANGEAVHFLGKALELAPEAHGLDIAAARLRLQLAEAHLKLSNLAACREQLLQGLQAIGHAVRGGRAGLLLGIGRRVFGLPGRQAAPAQPGAGTEIDALAAQFHQLRAEVAYFEHDALSLLHGTFSCLHQARATGPSRELAMSHGTAAIVLGLLGAGGAARRHLHAAEQAAAACGHLPTVAYVRHLACVCHSAVGAWAEAEASVAAAAHGYREVGELYRWQSTRMILAYQALHRGQFARVAHYLEEADAASVFPSGPQQVRIWFRTAQLAAQNAGALLGTGPAPSNALVKEVEQLAELADPSQALLCHGFTADALRLQGRWPEARRSADRGLAVLRAHRPTTYYSLLGIASIAGTFLSLADHDPSSWPVLRPRAGAAIRALRIFAIMVPIATPSVYLLRARMQLLDGRVAAGERLLHQAIARAEHIGTLGVAAAARRLLSMTQSSCSDRATQTGWV